MGYHRAGFDVVGVDINPQPHYPFEFVQGDALTYPLSGFDVVHASPPCQAYSITKNAHNREHPDLLPAMRERLEACGSVWVIENVPGAPMVDPIVLCGSMFNRRAWDYYIGQTVRLQRHRLFDSSTPLDVPANDRHDRTVRVGGVYGGAWPKNAGLDPSVKRTGGYAPPDDVQRSLMGIHWMNRRELAQSIPPAYTQYIGEQLMAALTVAA
jgi:DNA (cytosine-5)-methyltransferase 1